MTRIFAKSAIALTLALLSVEGTLSVPHGGNVLLSETGFSFFGNAAVSEALGTVKTLKIPDINDLKFDCAGHCKADVTDITLGSLACGTPTFKFVSTGSKVAAAIPSCTAVSSASFRLKRESFPEFSCSGSIEIEVESLSGGGSISVTESGGALKLSSAEVQTSVDKIKLHFSGDCKLLGDIVKGLIEKAVVKQIDDQLGGQISKALDAALAKFNVPTSFTAEGLTVDARVVAEPSVSPQALMVPVAGVAAPTAGPPFAGTCPPPPSGSSGAPTMVRLAASSCVPDSFCAAAFELNLFSWKFDRTLFSIPVEVGIGAIAAPTVVLKSGNNARLLSRAKAYVNVTSLDTGAEMDIDFAIPVSARASAGRIYGLISNVTMADLNVTVTVNSTHFGLNATVLEAFMVEVINEAVLPTLDKTLSKGYPLPSPDGITLADATVAIGDGYLAVDANFAHPSGQLFGDVHPEEQRYTGKHIHSHTVVVNSRRGRVTTDVPRQQ